MACYRKTNGKVESFNTTTLTPCGGAPAAGAQACCSAGDSCLSNSICHYNEPSDGGSGYYLAGCTDPNFKNPACMQACTDLPFQDVVFNFTSNLWECCGNQHACGAPVSSETFQALPPSQLQVIGTAAANAGAASDTPAPSPSAGLSTGAAIGIAITCTIVFLALVGLAAWRLVACARRRKQRPLLQQPQQPHDFNSYAGFQSQSHRGLSEISSESKQGFLAGYPRVHLLNGGEKREMEG